MRPIDFLLIAAFLSLCYLLRAAYRLYEARHPSVELRTVPFGLRAAPRSVGMIGGAITLIATRNPYLVLGVYMGAWFVTFLIKSKLLPSIVDTKWSWCVPLLKGIGEVYPLRWFLWAIAVIVALFMGALSTPTLWIMGGLFVYDFLIVIIRDS